MKAKRIFRTSSEARRDYLTEMRDEKKQKLEAKYKQTSLIISCDVVVDSTKPVVLKHIPYVATRLEALEVQKKQELLRQGEHLFDQDRIELETLHAQKLAEQKREQVVDKLMHGDLADLNRVQFKLLLANDALLENLKARLLTAFYANSKEYGLQADLKFLLSQMDKDLWLGIRKGKMTLNQIKTRVYECIDGYRHKYVDLDDLKD
jgi:hypothetical protein